MTKEQYLIYAAIKDHKVRKGACQYYRVEVPLRGLIGHKLAQAFIDDGKYDQGLSLQNMFSSDIFLMFALAGEQMHSILDQMKQLKPGYAMDGTTLRYPPSVVFDIDDNIDWVHPFNPTYAQFGIRAPDGTVLKPGDSVWVRMDNGKEVALWEDGVSQGDHQVVFDIARNLEWVKSFHSLITKCDGATFPSKYLGKYYEENWDLKDWYLFPNSIVPEDYPDAALAPHEGIRILWQGGMSHAVDWFPVMSSLVDKIKVHPQSKMIVWGARFRDLEDKIPPEQYERHVWVDYGGYKFKRVLIDADINLCPLIDNEFNRCKSAIKWYEGCVLRNPEATLAAKVPPYSDEIIDGETGLLYEDANDFANKLSALIENKDLRLRLAENAKRWVLENRSYERTVLGLYEYYRHLREKKVAQFAGTKVISAGSRDASFVRSG